MKKLLAALGVVLFSLTVSAQDMNLSQVLIDGEDWQKGAAVAKDAGWDAQDARGHRYEYSAKNREITHFPPQSKDGKVVVADVTIGGMAVKNGGALYYTVPEQQVVYLLEPGRAPRRVAAGFGRPTGIVLTPDQGTLVVADANDKCLWAYRVDPDRNLVHKERYYDVWVPRGQTVSGVTALTVDAAGRVYAATRYGVQMFDPTGRLSGILQAPAKGDPGPISGFDGDVLQVQYGDRIFGRKLKAKGVPKG